MDCQLSESELEALLRRAGLEVAAIETRGVSLPKVVVARILESKQHPNADRLSVCQVDDGSETPRQIVCGAKNYKVGDKVPLALPGAVLPGDFKIKVGKLRGVESEGMMCSAKELSLAEEADGLLILDPSLEPGTPLSEVFPAETLLELEITPNRPDWLSHLGVAREVGVFTGAPVTPPPFPVAAMKPAGAEVVLHGDGCTYYTLRRIQGVRVAPSPAWLKQRLEAVGLRAITNVVDVTNYILFELGQPLHAFDASKVSGPLQVREASTGETFAALDGKTYLLEEGDLVIADNHRILALAGVMGGQDSGVTETTTEILLESAVFDPARVRRTSRRLGLLSDSSYRFERGIDPEMVASASARAAELITQIAGGTADEELLETGNHWARPEIPLRHARARALLGAEIADDRIEEALSAAGFERLSGGTDSLWAVPGYRREVMREVDLVEEIVRVIGIENIPSRAAASFAPASDADAAYDFAMALRLRLTGAGFHEARTSTLVSEQDASWFGPAVALKNPFGDEQSRLRTSLLPGLLAAVRRNLDQGAESVCLFEAGRVFHPDQEAPRLALVACGPRAARTWRGTAGRGWDVFDLKGLVGELCAPLEVAFVPVAEPPMPFGAALSVMSGATRIGLVGILHPGEARRLGLPGLVLAECDLAAWRPLAARERTTSPLPKFPASSRDIALVAPAELAFAKVEAQVHSVDEPLLEAVELFDLFADPTGEKLPADKKSLAISLTFRAPGRTLTAEEVSAATDRIRDSLRSGLGVDFRE